VEPWHAPNVSKVDVSKVSQDDEATYLLRKKWNTRLQVWSS
jgi:hypothetical protein